MFSIRDYMVVIMSCSLSVCVLTCIYWGYVKVDRLLEQLPNCKTLINRADFLKDLGVTGRMHLMFGIAGTVTIPKLLSRSDIISMEDIEKLPRLEKIKLAILFWATYATLALMACYWVFVKLEESW